MLNMNVNCLVHEKKKKKLVKSLFNLYFKYTGKHTLEPPKVCSACKLYKLYKNKTRNPGTTDTSFALSREEFNKLNVVVIVVLLVNQQTLYSQLLYNETKLTNFSNFD